MNTRILMIANSIVIGILGIAASFMPQEIAAWLGLGAENTMALIIQLLGAGYMGFAIMNWMGKSILIGGIYARPLALGNFMHYAVGALAIIKAANGMENAKVVWLLGIIYLAFAISFGLVLFTHPLKSQKNNA